MQLAGSQCCFCSHAVVLHAEATACSGCKSIAHKACLQKAGNACPACRGAWLNMADAVVHSQRCPSCGGPAFTEQLDRCSRCGSQTAWDTYADYLAARRQIHGRGMREAIGGSVALLTGGFFLAFLTGLVVQPHVGRYEQIVEGVIWSGKVYLAAIVLGIISVLFFRLGLRRWLTAWPMLRFDPQPTPPKSHPASAARYLEDGPKAASRQDGLDRPEGTTSI